MMNQRAGFLAKPALVKLLDKVATLFTLAAFAIAFRRLKNDSFSRRALWPAAMAGLTFVAPLAWSYHFIAPICAVGLLPVRIPQRGYLIAGLVIAGLSTPTLLLGSRTSWPHLPGQLLGSLAIMGMIAAFIWAARNAQLVRCDPGIAPALGKRTASPN
ncbi:hypothetical protein [Phaeovulum sp.]|uniref:hypothetical protein n=1 Tax=Phaeovulum sp. TaxID=2934796 RepID=UPI0039E5132D